MLLPPKKFLSVLEALGFIGLHSGSHPVSAKEICKSLASMNERYLEPIMQKLVHAKILRSNRGPKGGYVLARERRKITLGEIFTIVQGAEESVHEHSLLGKQVIFPLWNQVEEGFVATLHGVTLDDICKQAEMEQSSLKKNEGDFTI